ncbi:MAG: single-stranded-DNA-specific exonuclease RecJ [Candidatus Doudnabacteria bacterium]
MKKQWKVKNFDAKILPNLPQYPNLILKLLSLRGIASEEGIGDFLDPDFNKLHDPFLFKQMQTAVTRIWKAIEYEEKITIFADYDADAITACAVLYLALRKLGAKADYYIPDRFTEGYGLNQEAIKSIAEKTRNEDAEKRGLIITVDCGMNAVDEAELAAACGVDLIITDHHELTGKLPRVLAIINPKNPNDEYPFLYLTGVGVAFKLVQALFTAPRLASARSGQPAAAGWEKWLLDLVALGTVADCQSLTSENRILVSFGLKVLAKTKWPGLKALLATAQVRSDKYDAFTLGFILAPRINAAGRIKHADIAFKLLISGSPDEAEGLAGQLNDLNKHRQMLTEQITSEARSQIELISDKKVLLAVGQDWPKGVVGLVAGRLAEEYNRPVVALSTVDGVATGSGRSVIDFDLVAALNFSKDFLQKYGGHTQAAGFTLAHDNIPGFHQKLLEYADLKEMPISDPVLEIDAEAEVSDITWDNLNYLERFGPFGFGNSKPKFVGRGMEVLDSRLVGATGQHLKLRVRFGVHMLEAIAFGQGFFGGSLVPGKKIDVVFELAANEWNGNKQMQLKILDIKLNE